MEYTLILAVIGALLAIGLYLFGDRLGKKEGDQILTPSDRVNRIAALGMDKASEDHSHLLNAKQLDFQAITETDAKLDPNDNLKEQLAEFDHEMIVVLKADEKFKGMDCWDALLSLGLQWGKDDLFHWINTYEAGLDTHFSVWTTTPPACFLPEQIHKGKMFPQELVFGFEIPNSIDPTRVFEVMVQCVHQCQQRLGGVLLNQVGKPFEEEKAREELHIMVDEMLNLDLVPGSAKVLTLLGAEGD